MHGNLEAAAEVVVVEIVTVELANTKAAIILKQ